MVITQVAKRYRLPQGATPPIDAGVVKREVLHRIGAMGELMALAQAEADALLAQAQAHAEELRSEAREQAYRAAWGKAIDTLGEISAARDQLLLAAESAVAEVACAALGRLLIDVPPNWPARSSVRLLVQDWRGGADAELHIHPKDLAHAGEELLADRPWQVIPDESIPAGECQLVFAQGETRASYRSAVESLVGALRERTPHPL